MRVEVKNKLAELHARDGVLKPAAVVKEAKSIRSPLHSYFTWDDGIAARAHRLNQARNLIRVAVIVLPAVSNGPVRQYVSVSTMRKTSTGGYLATVQLLDDDAKREQALADAITVLQQLERRFRYLPELLPVWDAVAALTGERGAAAA